MIWLSKYLKGAKTASGAGEVVYHQEIQKVVLPFQNQSQRLLSTKFPHMAASPIIIEI